MYRWSEEQNIWENINIKSEGLKLNLYELNKTIINQLKPISADNIKATEPLFNNYIQKANNKYHMLLCKEYNYYTIFCHSLMPAFTSFFSAIYNIITELGDIYSIEQLDDGAVELWIKPTGEESPYVFYLFPYDAGVVYYG